VSRQLEGFGAVEVLQAAALVAHASGIPLAELLGHDRHTPIAQVRHVAVWATRERTGLSYPAIGRLFGGRDHRTIMHSCGRVRRALAGDDQALGKLAREVQRDLEDSPHRHRIAVSRDDVDLRDCAESLNVREDGFHLVGELLIDDALADAGDVKSGGLGVQDDPGLGEHDHDSRHQPNEAPRADSGKWLDALEQDRREGGT
jgi:hypothetical protein